MKRKFLKTLALAALTACGIAVAPTSAQNASHNSGDLILTVQNPGGTTNSTTTNIIVLGQTGNSNSTLTSPFTFRDAAAGSFTLLSVNVASTFSNFNITGGTPTSWYDLSTLNVGAVNYRGATAGVNQLLTGDPAQTLYFTKARTVIGTVGQAATSAPTIGSSFATNAVNQIQTVKGQIEATATTTIGTYTTGASDNVEDQNPVPGTGYGTFSGGVQGNFGAGSLGVFGAAGPVELALDLYRTQYRNDITSGTSGNTSGFNQYGLGAVADGTPQFLGTITIAQNGDVGYLKSSAVPEPSSMALMALAGLGLAARRRRSVPVHA